jgi:hypothetical protein
MRADKNDRVFTLVFTSCLLAFEFVAGLWWWSRKGDILWWLLLPLAVSVALVVLLRRTNRGDGRGHSSFSLSHLTPRAQNLPLKNLTRRPGQSDDKYEDFR